MITISCKNKKQAQRNAVYGLFIKGLELCRGDVDENSNESGASTMDNDCRDMQEVKGDNMIDGGLEAFWICATINHLSYH